MTIKVKTVPDDSELLESECKLSHENHTTSSDTMETFASPS